MQEAFASAYSPSHITGIFIICDNANPLYKGSIGCGIVLESGCKTEVSIDDAKPGIEINGKKVKDAGTSEYVLQCMVDKSRIKNKSEFVARLRVSTRFEVPVGCGFGASGAGALSTALALNSLLSTNMTMNEVAQIAHQAEVVNSTGLGDVVAEAYGGGIVLRKRPGPPGIGMVDSILAPCVTKISYVTFGKKSTANILQEKSYIRRINEAGRVAMKELLKKPEPGMFMRVARDFSLKCELMCERCRDAIEAVAAEGKIASVAMLGDTVFVLGDSEALAEFGEVKTSRISHCGAWII